MMKVRVLTALLLITVSCCQARAQANALQNPGFETGEEGSAPPGWFVPPFSTSAGYTVQVSKTNPKDGALCAVVSLQERHGQGFGNLMQSVNATRFRGKRVVFRAAVRYDSGTEPGQAQLWMRVDRPNGQMGFFDNMAARPITTPSWAFYQIVGEVASDAESVNVGLILAGGGKAWIDAASLEEDAPVVEPRALTVQGLANLVAFGKLYGYIRHFYPSDAVEQADWNGWAMAGVAAMEDARDSAELAARLETFFKPLAPTVQIFETGKAPAKIDPHQSGSDEGIYTVKWLNSGFGGGVTDPSQNIYRSTRVFTPKAKDDLVPATPFAADLGAGVSCRVPLALYATSNAALPHTVRPKTPEGVRESPTGDDRTTRLADVIIAWNVYEHFYPYFDVTKSDWPSVLSESLSKAATDKNARVFLDTLRRMAASANDGHGYVGHRSDDAFAGPPLLAEWVEGKFVVTTVGKDAGRIAIGDEILSIDGKEVGALWKASEPLIPGATEQWRRFRGQTVLLNGSDGSTLELEIKHGAAPSTKVTLKRSVSYQLKEKRPKPIQEMKDGIWYVDLDGTRIDAQEYTKALKDLQSAQGIVFDMRGYPNDVATDVIRRITTKPVTSALWNIPLVSTPDHRDMKFTVSRWPLMEPAVPRFRGKIAFITDGRAISYAETIMGIVEYYKLGAIVGEPTAGTNGNVNPFSLPGDYTVVFTGMKVLKHDGSQHHGIGILPTVPVHRTIAGVAAGKDELLEKAIAVVGG